MIAARDVPGADHTGRDHADMDGSTVSAPVPAKDEATVHPANAPRQDQNIPQDENSAQDENGPDPEGAVPLMAWLRTGAGFSTAAGPDTGSGQAGTGSFADAPAQADDPVRASEARGAGLADMPEADMPEADMAGADGADMADVAGGADVAGEAVTGQVGGAGAGGPDADDTVAGTGPLADSGRARIINAAEDFAAGDQWGEILTMFVDDPRGSVLEAAALVDEAIGAFIARVREQQESLAASWEARGTGTEELRIALQGYRRFWTSVSELRQPA